MAKKKNEITIRSSAAEYLTYVASVGDQQDSIEMRYEDENIWLTQKMMATLYDVDVRTINYHVKKIFSDSELQEDSVIRKFRITAADGKSYSTNHYSLEMIIAIGFKVNSELCIEIHRKARAVEAAGGRAAGAIARAEEGHRHGDDLSAHRAVEVGRIAQIFTEQPTGRRVEFHLIPAVRFADDRDLFTADHLRDLVVIRAGTGAHVDRAARDDHRNGLRLGHIFFGVRLVFKLRLHFIQPVEFFLTRALRLDRLGQHRHAVDEVADGTVTRGPRRGQGREQADGKNAGKQER